VEDPELLCVVVSSCKVNSVQNVKWYCGCLVSVSGVFVYWQWLMNRGAKHVNYVEAGH
jgi:hypothetical protein